MVDLEFFILSKSYHVSRARMWVHLSTNIYLFFALKEVLLMGLLSALFGKKQAPTMSFSIGAELRRISYTDEQVEMLKSGYKESRYHEIFSPDTVWFGPRSQVYHSSDCCSGCVISEDPIAVPEKEAIRRGLRRCRKCEWPDAPIPSPSLRPMRNSRPVSKCEVKRLR